MDVEIIEQINDLLNNDRAQLKKENSAEIISKLINKRDTLKENFLLNLPFNYNNEKEFADLFSRIETMNKTLGKIKSEKEVIASKLKETLGETDTQISIEVELEPLILKSIYVKRQMAYLGCMIKVEELKQSIELNIITLKSMKKDSKEESQQQSQQKADKRLNEKLEQYEKTRAMDQKNLFEKTVKLFKELRSLLKQIMETKCTNLIVYIMDSILNYHEKLKNLLIYKIEEKLKSISYPFITNEKEPNRSERKIDNESQEKLLAIIKEENENVLKHCIDWLLDIEILPLLTEISKLKHLENKSAILTNQDSNKITIVGILAKPFETRFKFHFLGNRKTNNYEKPEWFLSQIIKWIKDHEEFMNSFVQPIFENYNLYKKTPIIIDFSNRMVELVKKKINMDLHILIKNKTQFSHSINELFLFDMQLKTYLKDFIFYDTTSFYSCLHILCENDSLFTTWINVERQVCQKKLDMMFVNLNQNSSMSSPDLTEPNSKQQSVSLNLLGIDSQINDIWCCDYSDIDKMKPPHCAESFMSMIKAITDRFNELPYQSKKLQFVSLQIELINDFHLRICQIIRDEAKSPFGKIYLGSLNAVNYIMNILDEWKNSTFYIEMHYLKYKYSQFMNKLKVAKSDTPTEKKNFELLNNQSEESIDIILEYENENSKVFDKLYLSGESLFHNFHSLVDINGTLFDRVLSSYEKIKDEMMTTVISNCLWEIKTRSRNYKREKWISMPSISEYYKVILTQSAADMLISLKNLLFLLKDSLALGLFETILKRITSELDNFLFEEILLKNQFNEGGISQFDHDFNKYFLPILIEFSVESKNENLFRKTKESLTLLKLKQGSALLIKEIINSALHRSDMSFEARKSAIYNAKNTLKEIGIVQLTCEMAEQILSLRLY